jgi:hypothetical protein
MSELYTMDHHRELSGAAPKSNNVASPGMRFVALIIIVGFAQLGGFIVKVLSKG